VLVLPSATLVATTDADDYQEALDLASDKLAREIRNHVDALNRESVDRRRGFRRKDWLRVSYQLHEHYEADDREAFFELIRPVLRSLQQHARREIVLSQLSGELPSGYTTVSELVDEAIVSAWDAFHERPDDIPLESWLVNLVHSALQAMIDAAESVPLDEPLGVDDPRFEIENGWLAENEPFWAETKPIRYQDVLPCEDVAEALEDVPPHEQERALLRLLSDIGQQRRRTFTLHVVEGWGEEEIAMMQGRRREDVRQDLEAVRTMLRHRSQPNTGNLC
jgi:RNA polymerase sigma factor (sigma-70 family)